MAETDSKPKTNNPVMVFFATILLVQILAFVRVLIFESFSPEDSLDELLDTLIYRFENWYMLILPPLLIGFIVHPVVYQYVKEADLVLSSFFVFFVVLLEILVVTPFLGNWSLPGAFLVMLWALRYCKKRYSLNPDD